MKLSKFDRSQKAHTRLFNKHIGVFGSSESDIKSAYHLTILDLQRRSKKLLSRSEKKIIYSHSYEKVMGDKPSGSEFTYKDFLDVVRKYDKR